MPIIVDDEMTALRANLDAMIPALATLGAAFAADRTRRLALLRRAGVPFARLDELRTTSDQFDSLMLGALRSAGLAPLLETLRLSVADLSATTFEAAATAHLNAFEAQLRQYLGQ